MAEVISEVRTPSNLSKNPDIKVILDVANGLSHIVGGLAMNPLLDKEKYVQGIYLFTKLNGFIRKIEEKNLPTKDCIIMKLLRLIAGNRNLRRKLWNLNDLIEKPEEFNPRLDKLIEEFKLPNLACKIEFLLGMKQQKCFTNIREGCSKWDLYDLTNDEDFKQEFIQKAADEEGEPFSKNFRKEMDEYRKSTQQGKSIVNQYLKDKEVNVQAYYENSGSVLHANFVNYHGNQSIETSNILKHQKENTKEDTKGLDIYCNKKLEVKVRREDKGRNYEFEKGVHYQMQSTWPATDEHEKSCKCEMTMNISSNVTTQIVKFTVDDRNFDPSSEGSLKLIEQNKELRINGSFLCEVVKKLLEQQQNAENKVGAESIKLAEKEKLFYDAKKSRGCVSNIESTISDPRRDLEAVNKQLKELEVELTNLREKLTQAGKGLYSRYNESRGIYKKLGDLKQFICEMKERSNDPKMQNIWDKNGLSSLDDLYNSARKLRMNVNETHMTVEMLQRKFKKNLPRSDVKKLTPESTITDCSILQHIYDVIARNVSGVTKLIPESTIINCSISKHIYNAIARNVKACFAFSNS